MKLRKAAYLAHRWVGLIVSLQLLAWSLGGLAFSLLDIKAVRGERGAAEHAGVLGEFAGEAAPVARVVEAARAVSRDVAALTLRDAGLGVRWIAADSHGRVVAAVDPVSGDVLPRVSPQEAQALAVRDRRARVEAAATELIERDPPTEYRGKPLPAYRVALAGDERITVYVHAVSGEITARRNDMWRAFDFLWMLHIMDYRERENFNHWLLTAASTLAVLTAGSGLALWGWRVANPLRTQRRVY